MIRPVSLAQVAEACNAQVAANWWNVELTGLAIDSRSVLPGDLFVAISGERTDGHEFITGAADRGAAAVLTQRAVESALPQLTVADTEAAVGAFGALARGDFDGVLVGITGSAGKTTAKNLIAVVLGGAGNVLATEGNRNNELGVPLTLAALEPTTEFAVLEMGAGKPGDIAHLANIAKPNVAVLLNVAEAHIEQYGSLDAISQTKGAILDGLTDSDLAVINGDQPWSAEWRERAAPAKVVSFGLSEGVDYRAMDIASKGFEGSELVVAHGRGCCAVELHLPGMPGVMNALAAFAVGDSLGLSFDAIARGLNSVSPAPGRGHLYRLSRERVLVDDSYNANPTAMKATIDSIAATKAPGCLVMGGMLELGVSSDALHEEVGAYARARGVDRLWVVGGHAQAAVKGFGPGARFVRDWQELEADIDDLPAGSLVVVKASRGSALDRLVSAWLRREGVVASC